MELALSMIGGRWKVLILWHLSRNTRRFGELQRLMPGVTPKMLIQQLRELEADGLIRREIFAQVPPKVEYSLTDPGRSLGPVMESMCEWGLARMKAGESAALAAQAGTDPERSDQ